MISRSDFFIWIYSEKPEEFRPLAYWSVSWRTGEMWCDYWFEHPSVWCINFLILMQSNLRHCFAKDSIVVKNDLVWSQLCLDFVINLQFDGINWLFCTKNLLHIFWEKKHQKLLLTWNEMKWNEMRWDEMKWNEMKRDETRWNEMSINLWQNYWFRA
jgi:hypothetical protein